MTELEWVTDTDEADLVREVLTDPDRTMAQSAVLRHIDRRAAGLPPGPAHKRWAETMAQTLVRYPFLTRRLQEWSLFRAITQGGPWRADALLESSDWLQLKTAAASGADALQILAEHGRTRRIRDSEKANLKSNPR
jgi:hypothetical protein